MVGGVAIGGNTVAFERQNIITGTPINKVGPVATGKGIIAGTTQKAVITGTARKDVIADRTG